MDPLSQNLGPQPEECFSGRVFDSTQWEVVHGVHDPDPARAAMALEALARSFWRPLYLYLRHHGYHQEDAEDLVQGFFLHLLQHDCLKKASEERGRFRRFILACLQNFVAAKRQHAGRQKRGGGAKFISLDEPLAEQRCQRYLTTQMTSEQVFDQEWALLLVEKVLERLDAEAAASGKSELFRQVRGAIVGGDSSHTTHYADLARALGTTEAAIKMAVHRFRERCRELFRQELAPMVAHPDDIDDELHFMFQVLSR